jgi:hypothetical protein
MISGLGYAFAVAKHTEEAKEALAVLEALHSRSEMPAILLAYPAIGLGDNDRAFEWLEKAFQERAALLPFLNVEPMLDPLRRDSRFTDPMGRMPLVD